MALLADLEAFVDGGTISAALSAEKSKYTDLALLQPPAAGVWQIRSLDPKPSIRILGAFADVDLFICLAIEQRNRLKGRESRQWRQLVSTAKTRWNGLFPTYDRRTGSSLDDFVTEYVNTG